MFTKCINLQRACEQCGQNTYNEDESGFYVCGTCGLVSQIRFGNELEYDAFGRSFSKLKSKTIEHNSSDYDEVDGDMDNNSMLNSSIDDENETNFFTNVNTRQTSRIGDNSSVLSRRSNRNKKVKIEKSLNEVLLDGQQSFSNIFTCLSEEYAGLYTEEEKNKLVDTTKSKWMNYIMNEYEIQEANENSIFGRGRRMNLKLARSRTNTIDEVENKNYFCNKLESKKRKRKINEQIKSRRIKQRNIISVYEDEKHNSNKEMYKKFIEEYDQVIHFIKTDDILREKCERNNFDISTITHTLKYEEIIKVCIMLNINLQDDKNSFEDLIHKIFLNQSLNYQTTHSFSFNSQKSTLTGDYFLSIFYQSFNSLLKVPLLSSELTTKYQSFSYISKLNEPDLKMLRYFNHGKYIKLINQIDKNDFFLFQRAELILKYIIIDILNCKKEILDLNIKILNKIKRYVVKFMGQNYLIEHICIGIFMFSLKVFYGLNDLPYLSLFYGLIKTNAFDFKNEIVHKFVDIFDNMTKDDSLCDLYKNNLSQFDLVSKLKDLNEKEQNQQIMTLKSQMKRNFSKDYKEKYLSINYNHIYKDVQNNYALKNINELQMKFNKFSTKETSTKELEKKSCGIKIKQSEKFKQKKLAKNAQKTKTLNSFFKEEIDFYSNLKDTKNIEFPLPCDTFVKYQKHAHKFEGVDYKIGELMIYYFMSKYFKLDFYSLKSLIKFTERSIEKSEKL